MSVTKTEIKSSLKNELLELLYISHANNKPMYVNGRVSGKILACDVDDSDGNLSITFFWRSKNGSIKEPSDAATSSKDYLESMLNLMPTGYKIFEVEGKLRLRKEYSSGYSDKEIAREIFSVYRVFGGLSKV
jgi:hypothetical protein